MNYYLTGSICCISLSSIYLVNKYMKKTVVNTKPVTTTPTSYGPLNLTPHPINLYDESNNLLISIKPVKSTMQLRISAKSEKVETDEMCQFVVEGEYDRTKIDEEYMKKRNVWTCYESVVDAEITHLLIPVKSPVKYDTVDGIDELRNYMNPRRGGFIFYDTIIVSTMVAEFLMANKDKFSDLNVHVLVPNSDPKNSVRNESGMIIGVKSFIDYGKL